MMLMMKTTVAVVVGLVMVMIVNDGNGGFGDEFDCDDGRWCHGGI